MDETFLPLSVASSPCKRTARTRDHAQGVATAVLCAARLADHPGCGLWPCPANGVGDIATVGKYRCSALSGPLLDVVTRLDPPCFASRRPMNTMPTDRQAGRVAVACLSAACVSAVAEDTCLMRRGCSRREVWRDAQFAPRADSIDHVELCPMSIRALRAQAGAVSSPKSMNATGTAAVSHTPFSDT